MTCEHSKSTVMESRRIGAEVYRRRVCPHCLQVFVSVETAPPGLKMPTEGNNRKDPNSPLSRRRAPGQQVAVSPLITSGFAGWAQPKKSAP